MTVVKLPSLFDLSLENVLTQDKFKDMPPHLQAIYINHLESYPKTIDRSILFTLSCKIAPHLDFDHPDLKRSYILKIRKILAEKFNFELNDDSFTQNNLRGQVAAVKINSSWGNRSFFKIKSLKEEYEAPNKTSTFFASTANRFRQTAKISGFVSLGVIGFAAQMFALRTLEKTIYDTDRWEELDERAKTEEPLLTPPQAAMVFAGIPIGTFLVSKGLEKTSSYLSVTVHQRQIIDRLTTMIFEKIRLDREDINPREDYELFSFLID